MLYNDSMPKTILLVEDDPFLAKLYASYFDPEEFTTIIEPEGEQGLYRMQQGNVDLVLLDLLMPKKTGFDVLRVRKKDPALKNIPVIVLTSLEQDQDRNQALELGADDYFMKNELNLEFLLEKIRTLLPT